jgi:hypothetical protein
MSILWKWPPLTPYVESLEWLSDVMGHYDGTEQRMEARQAPRQALEIACMETGRDAQQLLAAIRKANAETILMPIWHEMVYVGPLAAGAGTITATTTAGDFRTGANQAVLWQRSNRACEALVVATVNAGSLVLTGVTTGTYTEAYVIPCRSGRIVGPIERRAFSAAGSATKSGLEVGVTWESDQNQQLTADAFGSLLTSVTGETLMVLNRAPLHKQGLAGSVEWPGQTVDSGTGVAAFDAAADVEIDGDLLSYLLTTPADIYLLRKWLHGLAGRRGVFIMPSYSRDLTIADTHVPPSADLVVNEIDWDADAAANLVLAVWADNGAEDIRLIDSIAAGPGAGETTLTLSGALHDTADDADLSMLCFAKVCRLAGDRVEIQHLRHGMAEVALPVQSVSA